MTRVGFVGLGAIGRPIAERLADRFAGLMVLDTPERTAPLEALGATVAATPAALADACDVVFSCVNPNEAYRRVALGEDGLRHGTRMSVYVHLGTTGAEIVHEIADALAANVVATVDAPMTGGPPAAREGRMTVMAAGVTADVARLQPFFDAYAKRVVHISERPGDGQALKLVNNMITAANLAIALEGLVLARKAGLDPEKVLEVINSGSARSDATETKLPAQVLTRKFAFGASMAIVEKDLSLCLAEAERLRVPMWVGTAVRHLYQHAIAEGEPADDLTFLTASLERWAKL